MQSVGMHDDSVAVRLASPDVVVEMRNAKICKEYRAVNVDIH